jgi:ligand-binding sensor domain-containing protein
MNPHLVSKRWSMVLASEWRLFVVACSAVILLLLEIVTCSADSQPYRIDTWQVENGLPQGSVTSMIQTREGYLWLGTFNGLVRFDGVQFKVFNPNNTPGLPSSRILQLFEDRQNALWIGTEEGSLVKYSDGRFKTQAAPGQECLRGYIQGFAETDDGALWLGTSERQLFRFASGRMSLIETNSNLIGSEIDSLTTDAKGNLWVSTDVALALEGHGTFAAVCEQRRSERLEPGLVASSHRGGCWAGVNRRLRRLDRGQWVEDFGTYPWSKGNLYCMVEDRRGQLWVGTYGSGLFRYSTNGEVLHISTREGLPGDLVRSLCEDREGDLWVGTEGDGLARLKPALFRTYDRRQGLSGDCVLSICEGSHGELWIGTNGDGLDRLRDGAVQHYGAEQGLANEYVWSVLQDPQGQVWAGTWGGGLYQLQGERFVPVAALGEEDNIVCALHQDRSRRLWVGAQRNVPEITLLRDGRPEAFRLQNPLARAAIRAVVEDGAGNLWVGTHGDGIYRIRGEHQAHFGKAEGLNNEFIRSLYADAGGVLWIGTYGGGLNRFEDGCFTAFTTRNGLPSDALCYITEDSRSNLWCGSLGGVFCVAKAALNPGAAKLVTPLPCISYSTVDGLPTLECSGGCQPSGWKTRDGRLWFPTVRGLAVVDPAQVPFNNLPPPVVIEQVVVEGKTTNSVLDPSILTRAGREAAISETPPTGLEIPAGSRRLEFRYTGLSLVAPNKVRFKYMLEGLEEDWVDAGPRRTANYSYLRPGKYLFRVRACNNDGVWSEQGASLALTILPYFWQTWWFGLLAVTAALLILVGVYELRLASARKLASLRLRIARDLHDEVGSNLGSIALLSEVMPKAPSGPVEEVTEIRRIAVQTISSLRDIVWFLDPAADTMDDLLLRMKETAKTMLPGIPFEFSSTGATSFAPTLDLRRNLFPLFKEILHNVAKHSRASRVEIAVHLCARELKLSVIDNGIGFDPAAVGSGNGLKNLRRRAADLRGTLEMRSRPGQGTTVVLIAPIT